MFDNSMPTNEGQNQEVCNFIRLMLATQRFTLMKKNVLKNMIKKKKKK